ncbi:hypothetical protein [Rossellomorea aquimaris]|uniref:hypothetical protein n=1 Tax=Rossellomorea aquimaris TaxID=189382 RepID=UPI0007D06A9C|nr:hypothetical protein [Rossellomorea aquimaris]
MTQPVSYGNQSNQRTELHVTPTNTAQNESSSKLLKGMVVGAVVGGALAMLDKTTRKKVQSTTSTMKDSTMDVVNQVKENPSGVMNDWQDRIKTASSVLKEAINDAQTLYEKVNEDVVDQVNQVKEDSSEIISTTKEAASELKGIGEKVKEASEEVTGDSTTSETNNNQSIHPTNRSSDIPGQVGS